MEQRRPLYSEALATRRYNWVPLVFLTVTPVIALVAGILQYRAQGFNWKDAVLFFGFLEAAGLSITAGYHRAFSHRSYEAHPIAQFLLLLFGAAAFENSALLWSSDHRYHHQFADKEGDPYNVKEGFWWAHIKWMFYATPERDFANVPDLKKNRLVMFQHRHYLAIAIFACFLLPMGVGALMGRAWGGLVWGGVVRMVVLHHITFMINSVAHYFGKPTFAPQSTARDSHLLGALSWGEGYHSYHHAFANDYRNGIHWYDLDQGKWLINGMKWVGLARGLKRVDPAVIEARLKGRVGAGARAGDEAAANGLVESTA